MRLLLFAAPATGTATHGFGFLVGYFTNRSLAGVQATAIPPDVVTL